MALHISNLEGFLFCKVFLQRKKGDFAQCGSTQIPNANIFALNPSNISPIYERQTSAEITAGLHCVQISFSTFLLYSISVVSIQYDFHAKFAPDHTPQSFFCYLTKMIKALEP